MGFVVFYDWETGAIVRRIEVEARNVSIFYLPFPAFLLFLTLSHFIIKGLLVRNWKFSSYSRRRFILRLKIRQRRLRSLFR